MPNPRPYQSPSILDEGLQNHLGLPKYAEFERRLITLNEPKSVIAKAMGVNRNTIYKWVDIYKKELDLQRGVKRATK